MGETEDDHPNPKEVSAKMIGDREDPASIVYGCGKEWK